MGLTDIPDLGETDSWMHRAKLPKTHALVSPLVDDLWQRTLATCSVGASLRRAGPLHLTALGAEEAPSRSEIRHAGPER